MGQHKDAASFTAVTQNLRGLTTKKLQIIIKNMEDKAVDITVLQETWKVTPTGVAIEELGNAARRTAASCHREPKRDQRRAKGREPEDQSRKPHQYFLRGSLSALSFPKLPGDVKD